DLPPHVRPDLLLRVDEACEGRCPGDLPPGGNGHRYDPFLVDGRRQHVVQAVLTLVPLDGRALTRADDPIDDRSRQSGELAQVQLSLDLAVVPQADACFIPLPRQSASDPGVVEQVDTPLVLPGEKARLVGELPEQEVEEGIGLHTEETDLPLGTGELRAYVQRPQEREGYRARQPAGDQ